MKHDTATAHKAIESARSELQQHYPNIDWSHKHEIGYYGSGDFSTKIPWLKGDHIGTRVLTLQRVSLDEWRARLESSFDHHSGAAAGEIIASARTVLALMEKVKQHLDEEAESMRSYLSKTERLFGR